MRAEEWSSEARILGLGPLLHWSKVSAILDLGMFWAQVLMESKMSQPKSPYGPTAIVGAVTHVPSSLLL